MTMLLIQPECGCSIRKGQIEYCCKHAAAETLLNACRAVRVYVDTDQRLRVKKLLEQAIQLADPLD